MRSFDIVPNSSPGDKKRNFLIESYYSVVNSGVLEENIQTSLLASTIFNNRKETFKMRLVFL